MQMLPHRRSLHRSGWVAYLKSSGQPSTSPKLQLHLPELQFVFFYLLSARMLKKKHDSGSVTMKRVWKEMRPHVLPCASKQLLFARISAFCIPDTFVQTGLVQPQETYEQHFDRSFSGFHSH